MEKLITASDGKSLRIRIFPDKSFTFFDITYPIVWAGEINTENIKIIQLGQSSSSIDDYVFEIFPEKVANYKHDIINAIDIYLKNNLD